MTVIVGSGLLWLALLTVLVWQSALGSETLEQALSKADTLSYRWLSREQQTIRPRKRDAPADWPALSTEIDRLPTAWQDRIRLAKRYGRPSVTIATRITRLVSLRLAALGQSLRLLALALITILVEGYIGRHWRRLHNAREHSSRHDHFLWCRLWLLHGLILGLLLCPPRAGRDWLCLGGCLGVAVSATLGRRYFKQYA
jgi:hypothetical protein